MMIQQHCSWFCLCSWLWLTRLARANSRGARDSTVDGWPPGCNDGNFVVSLFLFASVYARAMMMKRVKKRRIERERKIVCDVIHRERARRRRRADYNKMADENEKTRAANRCTCAFMREIWILTFWNEIIIFLGKIWETELLVNVLHGI